MITVRQTIYCLVAAASLLMAGVQTMSLDDELEAAESLAAAAR